jgi:ABC-2 type transport system permease protein/oleandomycin transport system permease protein
VLLGRTTADLALNALTVVLAFAYVFSWISAYIGISVRDPETARWLGFIWVFPLVFVPLAVRAFRRA